MFDEEMLLDILRILTVLVAFILLMLAGMGLGRKASDLDYQKAQHLNGVRKIQSVVNLRMHLNRILLALTYIITATFALFDVPLIWRVWIGSVLVVTVLLAFTFAAIKDWLDETKQVYVLMEEDEKYGVTALRTKAHVISNKLQFMMDLAELQRKAHPGKDTEDFYQISTEIIDDFKEMHTMVRGLDPANRTALELRTSGYEADYSNVAGKPD